MDGDRRIDQDAFVQTLVDSFERVSERLLRLEKAVFGGDGSGGDEGGEPPQPPGPVFDPVPAEILFSDVNSEVKELRYQLGRAFQIMKVELEELVE